MTTNAELKQPSTVDALSQYDGDDLLIAFLSAYNQQNSDWDEMVGENQRLQQELDGYKRQCSTQTQEIETLTQENKLCNEMAVNAEIVANKITGLDQELNRAKAMNRSLQNELKELNKLNPKKLKEQTKRQQAKAIENQKRITQLEQLLKEAGKAIKTSQAETNKAVDKIARLQTQLAHDTGSGLYHNGDHHLIIWPQKTKMQDADNNIFEGRSLLYLHKSGRGGLITYNPNTEEANLCATPRGGLRPSDEAKQFAQDWLFKVNEVQAGTVKEEDMLPVNYNGNFDGKDA